MIRIDAAEGSACHAINLGSGGFTAELRDALTDERKAQWGPLAYLIAGAATLPNRATYRVRLTCEDRPPVTLDLHALVVASGRTAGGGQPNAPAANPEDGLLDIVAARAGSLAQIAGLAMRAAARADVLGSDLVYVERARRVHVESEPAMTFVVDGEPKVETPATFTAQPGALRVVVGEGYQPDPGQPTAF
jgi:diacylglycerol kinase (ATP)